ncbi:MAG: hypothetical protein FWE40_07965 [Oscillospiraceae bacterium]|nr:hypothetical protein [Oscillospiraceae bacterium]
MPSIKITLRCYRSTNFAAHFAAHAEFYTKEWARFAKKYVSRIDLEWFRPYIDPAKLHVVLGVSLPNHFGFGAMAGDEVYFTLGEEQMKKRPHSIAALLFHLLTKPMADDWFANNETFRQLCNRDILKYCTAKDMAREYIAAVHVMLYQLEHGGKLEKLLRKQKDNGLTYIKDVYDMFVQE